MKELLTQPPESVDKSTRKKQAERIMANLGQALGLKDIPTGNFPIGDLELAP